MVLIVTTQPQTSETSNAEKKEVKPPQNNFGLTIKAEVSVPAVEKSIDKLPKIPFDFLMFTIGYILVSGSLSTASYYFEEPPGKNVMLILSISSIIYSFGLIAYYSLSLWKRFKK